MFLVPSLPAIVCGHIALRRLKGSPQPIRGKGYAVAGLVLGYVQLAMGVGILCTVPRGTELIWSNLCIVALLTAGALFLRDSRGVRTGVALFFFFAQFWLSQQYWIAYRSVPLPSQTAMEQWTTWEAWLKGLFAMYEYTRDLYIPLFVLYGVGLAILALTPYGKQHKEEESQPPDTG